MDESSFLTELTKDLKIEPNIDPTLRKSIWTVIQDNWDSFYEQGSFRPMFDFELCIDSGVSTLFYYRQSVYGIYERKIMNKHIQILEGNDWICDCEGPWGSLILLAPTPYQEGCTDINDFLWRLCVSYRPLNSTTKIFEFPIPHYANNIEDFGDFSGRIYLISLNNRSSYHQIRMRNQDQEI